MPGNTEIESRSTPDAEIGVVPNTRSFSDLEAISIPSPSGSFGHPSISSPSLSTSSHFSYTLQTISSTDDPNDLPNGVSAFQYAIREFIGQRTNPISRLYSPSRTQMSTVSNVAPDSPLSIPLEDETAPVSDEYSISEESYYDHDEESMDEEIYLDHTSIDYITTEHMTNDNITADYVTVGYVTADYTTTNSTTTNSTTANSTTVDHTAVDHATTDHATTEGSTALNGNTSINYEPSSGSESVFDNKVSLHHTTYLSGTSPQAREQNIFRVRVRLLHLRTLLMRCQILQSTVLQTQQPWDQNIERSPRWYYARIHLLAYQALRLATDLQSNEMLARCEYWAGRGCGGMREYKFAVDHFTRAIRLDIEARTTQPIRQSLKTNEKDDVKFLLRSVTARYLSWQRRCSRFLPVAEIEAERTGRLLEDCMGDIRPSLESPIWMPDRDWALAKSERTVMKFSEANDDPQKDKGVGELADNDLEDEVVGEMDGRELMLCEAEWRHDKYREKMVDKSHDLGSHQKSQTENEGQPKNESISALETVLNGRERSHRDPITLSSSITSTSPCSDWEKHRLLDQELEWSSWNDPSNTPQSRETSLSPPRSRLRSQRNLNLSPINTDIRVGIGKAVSSTKSDAEEKLDEVAAHHEPMEMQDDDLTEKASVH